MAKEWEVSVHQRKNPAKPELGKMYLLNDSLDVVRELADDRPGEISSPLLPGPTSTEGKTPSWSEYAQMLGGAIAPDVGLLEAGAHLVTGIAAGVPGGWAAMWEAGQQDEAKKRGEINEIDWGIVENKLEEVASAMTYMPQTEYGKWASQELSNFMSLPAQGVRAFGGKMIDWGWVSPEVATVITTPLEFAVYVALFKAAHGVLPKGTTKSGLTPRNLAAVEQLIKNDAIPKDVLAKAKEAVTRQESKITVEPTMSAEAAKMVREPEMLAVTRLTEVEKGRLRELGYKDAAFEEMSPEVLRSIIGEREGEVIKMTKPYVRKKIEPTKPAEPIEIPTFKDSADAYKFGETATPEQVVEMKRLAKEGDRESAALRATGKVEDLVKAPEVAYRKGQLNRDAIGVAEGDIVIDPADGRYKFKSAIAKAEPKPSMPKPKPWSLEDDLTIYKMQASTARSILQDRSHHTADSVIAAEANLKSALQKIDEINQTLAKPKPSEAVREGLESGKTREDLAQELYGTVTEETLGRVGDLMAERMIVEKQPATIGPKEAGAKAAGINERLRKWEEGDATVNIDAVEREALELYQSEFRGEYEADTIVFLERADALLNKVRIAKRNLQNKLAGETEPSPVRAEPSPLQEQKEPSIIAPKGRLYHGTNLPGVQSVRKEGSFSGEKGLATNMTDSLRSAKRYGRDKTIIGDDEYVVLDVPDVEGNIPLEDIRVHYFDKEGTFLRTEGPTTGQINIVDPTGKGFSTEGAARMWARGNGIEGKVIENPKGSGFVIQVGSEIPSMGHVKEVLEIMTDESGAIDVKPLIDKLKGKTRKRENKVIKSVSQNQTTLLQDIMDLFTDGKIDADITYSLGKMWKGLPKPEYKFDISPQTPDTVFADISKRIPLEDGSINSFMMDLPFLITKGETSFMTKRFGKFSSIEEAWTTARGALKEGMRVLKPGGKAIVKMQDVMLETGTNYFSGIEMYNFAVKEGYRPFDVMIYENPRPRPTSAEGKILTGEWKQRRVRKTHNYFWIFEKPKGRYTHPTASPLSEHGTKSRQGMKDVIDAITNEEGRARMLEDAGAFITEQSRRLRDWFKFNDWPDIKSTTYKTVFDAVEDLRINGNLSAFDAMDVRASIMRAVPDATVRDAITRWQEKPESGLSPEATAVAQIAKEIYSRYRVKLRDAGILNEFIQNYVNHIIQDYTKPTSSWIKHRSRTAEGAPKMIDDLEAQGYTVETDIGKLLPSYIYFAERALGRKAFANIVKGLKTPEGDYAILPRSKVRPEIRDKYIDIDDSMFRTWIRFGRKKARRAVGDAVIDKERRTLFSEPSAIHKDAYKLVESIFSDRSNEVYGHLAKIRQGVKRIIMYNPLIHGWNIESNVLMALGRDYPSRFRVLNKAFKDPDAMVPMLRRMVKNGVELEGLYDVSKRLGADIFELKATDQLTFEGVIKEPTIMLKHPIRVMKDLGDRILWDKWVKTGQIAIYDALEGRFLKDGLSPEHAGRAAANMTNDLMGTIPRTWFTRSQRRVLRSLLFARNWNVSNFRTLTGATGKYAKSQYLPKPLRFEGMTDAQLRSMGKQYRKVLVKGAIGIVTTANMIQAAFLKAQGLDFHSTFNNEKGHKFDIDTGMVDKTGRKIYLKNWLFRQIDDYAKFMSGHVFEFARAKAEPILRTLIEIVWNTTYASRDIRERGAPVTTQIGETVKYAVRHTTPIEMIMGREDEVRTWFEALIPLSGTWVRHGMPAYEPGQKTSADGLRGDLLRNYYDWSAEEKYSSRKDKQQVDKLIKLGKNFDAAERTFALMQEGRLSAEQFSNIVHKIAEPLWSRVATGPGGALKKEFVEFLLTLNPAERGRYMKELEKIRAGGARTGSAQPAPSTVPRGKQTMKVLAVE